MNARRDGLRSCGIIAALLLLQASAWSSEGDGPITPGSSSYENDDTVFYSKSSTLINLEKDPYESDNVYSSSKYKKVVSSMSEYHESYAKVVVEPTEPDGTAAESSWAKCGGVCAFLKDDKKKQTKERRFLKSKSKTSSSSSSQPNIVFVLVDDWGWNDVGYRSTYMSWTTPTIDGLAKEGVSLENYYTAYFCIPARASLMTGRYPFRTGMWKANVESQLPLDESTLAEELRDEGYQTYMVGKWHLGYESTSHWPTSRGFDSYYGFLMGKINYWQKTFNNYLDLHDGTELVSDKDEISGDYHSSYLFQSKAEGYIASHSAKYGSKTPFFLYYSMQMVHQPLSAPDVYLARCHKPTSIDDDYEYDSELNYCATNLMMDEAVANLTCTLDKYGYSKNTYLIIASDNGGDPSAYGSSYPYKGQKGEAWNGGVKVTAIVHSQLLSSKTKGSKYTGLMHVTDWYPTLLSLATDGSWKGKTLSGLELDGVDQSKALLKGHDSARDLIVHYHDGTSSVIQEGDYKLFTNYADTEFESHRKPLYTFSKDEDSSASSTICADPSFYSASRGGGLARRLAEWWGAAVGYLFGGSGSGGSGSGRQRLRLLRKKSSQKEKEKKTSSSKVFTLESSAVTDGVLAPEYTCWGNGGIKTGATIPLAWSNPPSGTKSFMLTLTTPQDGWTCARYDWVLYNIGKKVDSIQAGNTDVGTLGQTWPKAKEGNYFAKVPCPKVDDPSDAPETFQYTYTLYALSTDGETLASQLDDQSYADLGPELVIEAEQSNIVVGKAELTATYTCASYAACPASLEDKEERRLRSKGKGAPVTNADDGGECISLSTGK